MAVISRVCMLIVINMARFSTAEENVFINACVEGNNIHEFSMSSDSVLQINFNNTRSLKNVSCHCAIYTQQTHGLFESRSKLENYRNRSRGILDFLRYTSCFINSCEEELYYGENIANEFNERNIRNFRYSNHTNVTVNVGLRNEGQPTILSFQLLEDKMMIVKCGDSAFVSNQESQTLPTASQSTLIVTSYRTKTPTTLQSTTLVTPYTTENTTVIPQTRPNYNQSKGNQKWMFIGIRAGIAGLVLTSLIVGIVIFALRKRKRRKKKEKGEEDPVINTSVSHNSLSEQENHNNDPVTEHDLKLSSNEVTSASNDATSSPTYENSTVNSYTKDEANTAADSDYYNVTRRKSDDDASDYENPPVHAIPQPMYISMKSTDQ